MAESKGKKLTSEKRTFFDKGLQISSVENVVSPELSQVTLDESEDTRARFSRVDAIKKEVSSAPTYTPRNFNEQIVLQLSGGTYTLHVYFPSDGNWKSVAVT